MNKVRRIGRGGRRSRRQYGGCRKRMALRGLEQVTVDEDLDDADLGLADDSISASHLQNRSVRSEAIEDHTVHSIHLAPESVTSTKLALESVFPAHLAFNPVQGIPAGGHILQQFGQACFSMAASQNTLQIPIPLGTSYKDGSYVMLVSCNQPGLRAWVITRRQDEAVLGVMREQGGPEVDGEVFWLAVGGLSPDTENNFF